MGMSEEALEGGGGFWGCLVNKAENQSTLIKFPNAVLKVQTMKVERTVNDGTEASK